MNQFDNALQYGQFYLSGEGFMKFVIDLVYTILYFFSNVFSFFSAPVYTLVESMLNDIGLSNYPFAEGILSFVENSFFGQINLLGFMFGTGLVLYLAVSLAKWLIDILP